eukprot:1161815-Pelagomonas_calceolata.AAC.3
MLKLMAAVLMVPFNPFVPGGLHSHVMSENSRQHPAGAVMFAQLPRTYSSHALTPGTQTAVCA